MKKVIFGVLIFTAGLGIGGGVGYLVCKKKFDEKLERELEKNQDYYIKLLGYSEPGEKEVPEDLKDAADEVLENADEEIVKETNDEEGRTYKYTNKINSRKDEFLKNKTRIRYDKIPSPDQEEVNDVEMLVNNDRPTQDICIITADQFAREQNNFEKTTLLWWPENNLVTTEDYDILDVPDLIGTEWQDRIGEFEKDVAYVRNYISETDYEIVQQHDNYYDYSG